MSFDTTWKKNIDNKKLDTDAYRFNYQLSNQDTLIGVGVIKALYA